MLLTVILTTREAANSLINNEFLHSQGLKASIPFHKIYKQGLIRDVPLDIPEQEILEEIRREIAVLSVKRLTQRNRNFNAQSATNNNNKFILSRAMLVTFDGQELPEFVSLFGSFHRVGIYVPRPKICFKCYRFNHINKQCQSKSQLCIKCGEDKEKHENKEMCKVQENLNALTVVLIIFPLIINA